MDTGLLHQLTAKGQALCRIMVTTDDAGIEPKLILPLMQTVQEIIQQANRFRRRLRSVIDITGNEDNIRLLFINDLKYLIQNRSLVFHHGELIHSLPQMQI